MNYSICLLSLISLSVFPQDKIDFQNKKISKEIEKVYHITDIDLKEIESKDSLEEYITANGKYYKIINQSETYGYAYVGRVNTCRAGVCSNGTGDFEEGFEYFDYFILYDNQPTIRLVKIYSYQATHGHEISAKRWLKQFSGYDGADSLVIGQNIDAISGATVSIYSITYDIMQVHNNLKELLNIK